MDTVMSESAEYIEEIAGLYFRSILLDEGSRVPQHKHDHDHATLVASGSVLVWVDGAFQGNVAAPRAILIRAGAEHMFQAQEPNTRLVCVHCLATI